jgi:hypothetical protein
LKRRLDSLTQAVFGQRLGAKWFKIKDIESGRLKVTEEFAIKINREFGISYNWILTGEGPKEKPLKEGCIQLISFVNVGPHLDLYEEELATKVEQPSTPLNKKTMSDDTVSQSSLKKTSITLDVYFDNSENVAIALKRAAGKCEACHAPAPFKRTSDNTPYLEVHHIKPLHSNGDNSLENIVVLCPNCHRRMHFG